MFGIKINEFDTSDGSVESFNKIFKNTPISAKGYVEILDISEGYGNVYVRDVSLNGDVIPFDFGENNFKRNDLPMDKNIRFKYFARDLENNIIASAFNIKDLSDKLDCGECLIKSRIKNPITKGESCLHLFNVYRVEL